MNDRNWYAEPAEQTARRLEQIRSAPPPAPEIGGLFYRGQTHSLAGRSDAGKSLFMALVVRDLINAGGTALWIDHEQGAQRVLRRLMDFGATDAALIDRLWRVHYPLGPPPADLVEAYAGVNLVVIDALTGVLASCGLSSNADTEVEQAYAKIMRPLAELGPAVVTIDHMGHGESSRPIGSGRKTGAVDVELLFKAVGRFRPGQGGRAKITVGRDRDAGIEPCEFVLEPDSTWRLERADAFRPTALMQKVSEYLEAQTEPVSRASIERDVQGRREYLRQAIDLLVLDGFVAISAGARSSHLCSSIEPYRAHAHGARSNGLPAGIQGKIDDIAPPRPDIAPGEAARPRPAPSPLQGGEVGRKPDDEWLAELDATEAARAAETS